MRVLNSFALSFSIQGTTAACTLPHWGKPFFFVGAWFPLFVLLWEEQSTVPAIWFQSGCARSPWLKVKSRTKDFHLKLPVCTHTNTQARSRSTFKNQCRLSEVKVVFLRTCNQDFINAPIGIKPAMAISLVPFYLWERETSSLFWSNFCYSLMGLKIMVEKKRSVRQFKAQAFETQLFCCWNLSFPLVPFLAHLKFCSTQFISKLSQGLRIWLFSLNLHMPAISCQRNPFTPLLN